MSNKSLLEKVDFLLATAAKKSYTNQELTDIKKLAQEHSDHMTLGKFMGYSVSDYAIATLNWLGTDETDKEFSVLYADLPKARKNEVNNLISKNLYLQY